MRYPSCLLITLAALGACGPTHTADDDDDPIDAATDARVDSGGPDGEEPDFSRVYTHSGQVLYRLDTNTLVPVEIGPFGLSGPSITDIAIDRDDRMLGITLSSLYRIDIATGAATLVTAISGTANLTSLSFVPTDLNDPNSLERLVAATDQGTVLEINPTTGATTDLGTYGSTGGELIRSSGDIIAISGLGIYATVTIGDTLTDPDYLAQINPTTWQATPLAVGTGFDRIFGVGFWRGKVYGFVDLQGAGGSIVEINPNTGASTTVNTGSIRWFGAGVATDAPIIP